MSRQGTGNPAVTATVAARPPRTVPAACAGIVAVAVLSGLLGDGPLWWVATVTWIAGVATVGTWLLTRSGRSRSLGIALLLPASALAVLGAATVMGFLGRLGLPLTPSSSRALLTLALLGSAWLLSGAVARGAVARGTAGRVAAITLPALVAPLLLLLSYPALLGRTSSARLTSMLDGEDAAAWISQTFAALRLGHLPGSSVDSGYWDYPPTAAATGMVTHLAVGAPGGPAGDPVTHAIDAVFASWVLAGVCLGLIALGVTVVGLVPGREGIETLPGHLLGSTATQLCSYSLVFGLMGIQHLSLAWEGVALAALVLVLWVAGRAGQSLVAAGPAVAIAGFAAGATWPFGALSILAVAALLGLAVMQLSNLGRAGNMMLVAGMALGVGAGLAVNLAPVLSSVGPSTLLAAGGGTVPVPVDVLLVMAAIIVAAVWAVGHPLASVHLRFVLALTGGLSLGALVLFGTQLLPVAATAYGRDKATYLAILSLPLMLAGMTAFLVPRLPVTSAVAVAAGVTLLFVTHPILGGALGWGKALATSPRLGQAERIITAAQSGLTDTRTVCLPSARQGQSENYLCQRWMDALSTDQSDTQLRQMWWDAAGETHAAVTAARSAGRLSGAKLVDALWVMAGVPDDAFEQLAHP